MIDIGEKNSSKVCDNVLPSPSLRNKAQAPCPPTVARSKGHELLYLVSVGAMLLMKYPWPMRQTDRKRHSNMVTEAEIGLMWSQGIWRRQGRLLSTTSRSQALPASGFRFLAPELYSMRTEISAHCFIVVIPELRKSTIIVYQLFTRTLPNDTGSPTLLGHESTFGSL